MLIPILNLLNPQQVAYARQKLDTVNWTDGSATAGIQAQRVKRNREVDSSDPVGRELGDMIVNALSNNGNFMSAALPLRIIPPKFNRYEGGERYGGHVDNAILGTGGTRVRADLSMTVFFSEPHEYDGGELRVHDTYGHIPVKLPAGCAILYTATSVHEVTPVTRGARTSSFFWMQSLVRDDTLRTMLYNLDQTIISLREALPDHAATTQLVGHYHKLLQKWAET
jgi:PKHD-type hydroxylase